MKDDTLLLPEALQWSEGMLLSPQHLQQNDIYWHQQLHHRMSVIQPYGWGVLDLVYDESALGQGKVVVHKVEAVMPDGLLVQYPGNTAKPLLLDLKTVAGWTPGTPLRVYLAVPIRAAGAASTQSSIQRFDVVPGGLEVDENLGESRVEVDRLRPRLLLLPEPAVSPKYTAFPLLEIHSDAGGHYRISRFHPPLLRISAGQFLGAAHLGPRLQKLTETIRYKIRDLVGGRSNEDSLSHLDVEVQQQLFVAQKLAAMLLPFEVQLGSGDGAAHPYALYLGLACLAGHLAAIGAVPSPPLLPPYRHDDCVAGFDTALEFIDSRLALIAPAFESLLLDHVKDGSFSRRLPGALTIDGLLLELRPRQGQNEAMLRQWLARARIASEALVPVLKERRLSGAGLKRVDVRQVSGLNLAEGAILYEIVNKTIEVKDQLTSVIHAGQLLIVEGPGEGSGPREIVLHYRHRGEGGRSDVASASPGEGHATA